MKYLLLTANETDGVGQHAVGLNKHLQKKGHNSKILLLHKNKTKNLSIIKLKRSIYLRLFNFIIFDLLKKNLKKIFTFGNSTIKFKDLENYIKEADIIIIYTMHKLLSFKTITKIFECGKIVYLRPLDMEFASGGCHVNLINNDENVCNKFIKGCDKCPQLNTLNLFNLSKRIFNKKKFLIEKYKPKVFVENTYTQKIYNKSSIFSKHKVKKIFLGTNQNRQKNFTQKYSRQILNFSIKEKILLFGTYNLDAKHKGGNLLPSILKNLNKIIETSNVNTNNNIRLVTFGRKNSFNIDEKKIKWTHIDLVKTDKKLNLLYRSADVLLSPATYCNGPHIVSEALANNLPVIAFNVGVAQDNVINKKNGYLVSCFETKLFAESIYKVLFLKKIIDKEVVNKKLKKVFNSFYEAETIIKHSKRDIKIASYENKNIL